MIKVIGNIDIDLVVNQYMAIEDQIQWVEMYPHHKQAGLQYAEETENLWAGGTGKLTGLVNPEHQYNNINPLLRGTIFEDIINEHKLVRTRFMWVNRMSCYSMHRDLSPRVHVPIITNPECYFVLKQGSEGLIEHLPAGKVYWTDTRIHHTFMNCSLEPRLHLIGVPVSEQN
jgi:hypothetical protein